MASVNLEEAVPADTTPDVADRCSVDRSFDGGIVDLTRADGYVMAVKVSVPTIYGPFGGPRHEFSVEDISIQVADTTRGGVLLTGAPQLTPIPGTPSQENPASLGEDEIEQVTVGQTDLLTFNALTDDELASIDAFYGERSLDEPGTSIAIFLTIRGRLSDWLPVADGPYGYSLALCRGCLGPGAPCREGSSERPLPCALAGQDFPVACISDDRQ